MVKQPVNDVMAEKIYVKIAMMFFTVVGLAGGCMSIAGPVVGLTINPNELTATNFKQVERFGLSAALYFDCDKVDGAFGQKMVAMMTADMGSGNTTIITDDDARTSTQDTFESLCNDRKASHLYIAVTTGVFTLVGMFVFIACAILKKFEPDFVYIVPLGLSFLMIYDYVETNSSMFAYIKTCTELDVTESNTKNKLKNVIVWAPYPNGTFGRYGVTKFGKACEFRLDDAENTDEDKAELHAIMDARGDQSPLVLPDYPPNGACRPDLANDIILCTKFYSCDNKDNSRECAKIDIKEGTLADADDDQEDRACNDLGGGLIVWILGALFNVIANGMMLSALVIRKGKAEYSDDGKEMQEKRVTAFGET